MRSRLRRRSAGTKTFSNSGRRSWTMDCATKSVRGAPPEVVFAQTLLGFETVEASMASHDDTWVGINFVQPEDGFLSMRDYSLQMKMLDYLHAIYPKVHISLHAGEVAPGLVPPEGLRFHIRQAV